MMDRKTVSDDAFIRWTRAQGKLRPGRGTPRAGASGGGGGDDDAAAASESPSGSPVKRPAWPSPPPRARREAEAKAEAKAKAEAEVEAIGGGDDDDEEAREEGARVMQFARRTKPRNRRRNERGPFEYTSAPLTSPPAKTRHPRSDHAAILAFSAAFSTQSYSVHDVPVLSTIFT